MAVRVKVELKLRAHQLAAMEAERRFQVLVWHRRAGKTFHTVARMLARALTTNRKDWRAYYIAPTYRQAKAIAWDYLKRYCAQIPLAHMNESELRVDLPNGSRIQLLGAESFDTLRGRYADDVVLDETAHIPSAAWHQVISPMLADRIGRATFIGTPNGRMNLFYELWELAGELGDDWSRDLKSYDQTNVIHLDEIRRMRASMREEAFAQELECSWEGALVGAFYAKDMAAADAAGRVTEVRHVASLPVVAALDLGWSDAMVVGFFQEVGSEHHCIGSRTYEHTSLPDMVADLAGIGFPIAEMILPHDARVTELGTGKSRQEVLEGLGVRTRIAPNQSVHEGIAAVRLILPNMWFDRGQTKMLREAMVSYRSEYDEVRRVHRMTPLHDWSSHYADMMRYYAVGRPGRLIKPRGDDGRRFRGLRV